MVPLALTPILDGKPGKIYTDLVKLRAKVGGLKAEKKDGVTYKVKSAAGLMAALRAGLDELKMVSYVANMVVTPITPVNIEGTYKRPTRSECSVTAMVYVGSDDGSGVYMYGAGHGMDTDDKAEGKASTYAWKDALIKGLNLPDADMPDADDEQDIGQTGETPFSQLATLLQSLVDAKTLTRIDEVSAQAKGAHLTRGEAQAFVAARDLRRQELTL